MKASSNSASTKMVTPHLKRTRSAAKQTLERGHLQAWVEVDAQLHWYAALALTARR